MKTKLSPIALSLILLSTHSLYAGEIEQIEIIGKKLSVTKVSASTTNYKTPDIADQISFLPGANVNKNGPVTGIVQYRGLYGDRVSISIDGQSYIGAGPNAMDTPLSYSPNIITDTVSAYRGIAPVSSGLETLAGSVATQFRSVQLAKENEINASGELILGYRDVNDANKLGVRTEVATDSLTGLAYFESNTADATQAPNNLTIPSTHYDKTQAGLVTSWQQHENKIEFAYHYTDTRDTGTASLPMDITFIYGNKVSLNGEHSLYEGDLTWRLGFLDANHEMDNFAQRTNNNAAMHRINNALSTSKDFSLEWRKDEWNIGVTGLTAKHDSVITNPNNAMFKVVNFNNVVDTKLSAFVEYTLNRENYEWEFGTRVTNNNTDTDKVSHHMTMMNTRVGELVNNFNNSDRDISDTNIDLFLKWHTQMNNELGIDITLARKQRAPSYQERFLWMPMEATGGLADGNTYIGNINLDSETANQFNAGLDYTNKRLNLFVDIFYQEIDNYIQALPSMNMNANMIAKMTMNADYVLQFSNVDATLHGVDGQINYTLNDNWQLGANINYVRGKRDDISDNLYRVAPLNSTTYLKYANDYVDLVFKLNIVNKQKHVSAINREKTTAGYATADIDLTYHLNKGLKLTAGVSNLFDKTYFNHLSGYNRVMGTALPVRERLPNEGRTFWGNISLLF